MLSALILAASLAQSCPGGNCYRQPGPSMQLFRVSPDAAVYRPAPTYYRPAPAPPVYYPVAPVPRKVRKLRPRPAYPVVTYYHVGGR